MSSRKQVGRYLSYKIAFERLEESLTEGWLLEALAIEESIISDRLMSILSARGVNTKPRESLKRLIEKVKKVLVNTGNLSNDDLFKELDEWREQRNECIHSLCQANAESQSERSIELFSEKLWNASRRGYELAELSRDLANQIKRQ